MVRVKTFLLQFSRVLALFALSLAITTLNRNFLQPQNLVNVVRQASPQIMMAVGMTLVMLTANIDLSQGAVMTLASVLAAYALKRVGIEWWLASLMGLGVAALCGLVTGLMVAKIRLPSPIATYGMLWIARGASYAIGGSEPIFGFPEAFRYLGRGQFLGLPVPIWIMAAIVVAGFLFLKYTTLGRSMYSVGASQPAAVASGIRVDRTLLWTFILSALMAGLAGIILCARLNAVDQNMGDAYLLPSLAGPVMGGTSMAGGQGGVGGAVIGSLIMVVLINGMNLLNVSSLWQQLAVGAIVVLAVWLDGWMKRRSGQ
jgi:ribose transport system permease protein